ncbi:MAG TPA: hypothetical protein VHF26_06750 [Trebonia sp.]|nr:hypothetical protein [Trebonia sp.]
MWNTVCSLVWQLIPSIACPAVAGDGPARVGAFGIGTCSGPIGPGEGAEVSVPSEDSDEYDPPAAVPEAEAGLEPDRPSPIPSPAPATTTAAPAHAAVRRRRFRRSSALLASASARRLLSRELRSDTEPSNLLG